MTKKPSSPATETITGAGQEEPATSVADAGPHARVADFLRDTFPQAGPLYKQNFFEAATGHKSVGGALADMSEEILFARLRDASGMAQPDVIDHVDPGLGEQNLPVESQAGSGASATVVDVSAAAQDAAPQPSSALVVSEPPQINIDGPAGSLIVPHADRSATKSATRLIPKPEELTFITSFAPAIARSGFYPSVNTVEKATVLMLKGLSMGIQAMDALDGFDVIEDKERNKITLYPRVKLLKARVNETGKCRRFDVVSTEERCTVTIQREGRPQNVYTFTLEDARKMNLLSRYGWKIMPKRMLMWRACGLAISMEFPEVAFGLGVTDGDDEEAA